jgi:hypothetical protein
MRNRHFTRFGSPLTPSGALYYAYDEEGLVQMDADLQLEQLRATGNSITPSIRAMVKRTVEQRRAEYHAKVNQIGIPDKLKEVFSITKKAEAKRYCRSITISEYDLFLLIHNCSQSRFTHRAKFKPFVPQHLVISDADRKELKEGNPKRVSTKAHSALLERRYLHVHLFEHSKNWHCFYFSHQDIEPESTNHWKYGPHVHYISHLWPKLTKGRVWYRFNRRFTEISDSYHIRFEPLEFPKPGKGTQIDPNDAGTVPPWAVNFDPSVAQGCGSTPLPVAEVATRGSWVMTVSLPPRPMQ